MWIMTFIATKARKHAFGNETGDSYDAAAKEKAWARSLAFLKEHVHS